MRWAFVVAAGLAGLLLGGESVAVLTLMIADAALRLGPLARSRP